MIDSLFAALAAGLTLWAAKEKTKYVDQLIQLKKDYYAEINKPLESRSDAVLDDITERVRILSSSFSAAVASQNPAAII